MPVAINDKTGEVLALDSQGKWVPATRAKNPQTGEELYLDGSEWKTLNIPKPDPYANLSTDEIKKRYQQRKFLGSTPEELAGIADAYVRKEQQQGGIGIAVDDAVRSVARGVPVIGGAIDELSAGASSLMGGDYGEALDYQRARDRYMDENSPYLSTGLQIAGGVAGSIAGARALGLGGGFGAVPGRTSLMPTIPQALRLGGVGATVGATDGFTRGEGGVANRALNAGVNGALGGVLGVAAPYVGGALASGTQRVLNFLTSDQALRRLGISRNAANVLIRQLSADDTLTSTGAQRIRDAGPDAMLADAGQSSAQLLDTAMARSGPGSTAARQAVEQRARDANRGLAQELDNTFGPAVGIETRQAGIRQGTAAGRGAAYDDAYLDGVGEAVFDVNTPAGQEVAALWRRVRAPRRAAANALLEEAGLPAIEEGAMPTVRQLDYVTRALNTVARSAEGQGAMGGINDVGRSAQTLATQLRQAARTAVPEYGVALDTAADPIRRIQAIEFGSTLLSKGTTREAVVAALDGISGAERNAMRQGVRDQLDEIVANVKGMASDPNIDARQLKELLGTLSSDAARQKVTALLGQNAARSFFGQLGRFSRAVELRASVARNSQTYARTATEQQVKAQLEPGIIGSLLEGNPAQSIKKIFQQLSGLTPERRLAMEDQLFGEIANALTTVRGRQAEQMLRNLQRAIQARSANQAGARAIGGEVTGATFGAGQSAAQQAINE